MSATYSTTAMVAELAVRLPFGFTNQFFMDRLNLAYMWLKQKAGYKHDLKSALPVTASGLPTGTLPVDFDPGSEAALYAQGSATPVPYMTFDDFQVQRKTIFVQQSNFFSAWTFYGTTPPLTFEVTPSDTIVGVNTFNLLYHQIGTTRLTIGPAVFFPTPDAFDTVLIDRAEGEVRFMYDIGGSDTLFRMTEEAAKDLMDRYRSTKKDMAGMVDQIRQAQEATAIKSMTG